MVATILRFFPRLIKTEYISSLISLYEIFIVYLSPCFSSPPCAKAETSLSGEYTNSDGSIEREKGFDLDFRQGMMVAIFIVWIVEQPNCIACSMLVF